MVAASEGITVEPTSALNATARSPDEVCASMPTRDMETCAAASPRRAAGLADIDPKARNGRPAPPTPEATVEALPVTNGGVSNEKLTKLAYDGNLDRNESTVLEIVPDNRHCSQRHSSRHARPFASDDMTAGRDALARPLDTQPLV